MTPLVELVARHKSGQHAGIYSLCSAHPLVIESALCEARASGTPLLVEATSNQVNQDGGYTGMTPLDFRRYVQQFADAEGLAPEEVERLVSFPIETAMKFEDGRTGVVRAVVKIREANVFTPEQVKKAG